MKHEYNITLGTQNYTIKISTKTRYGYFEHNELGDESGGGMWFDGDFMLMDYDGVYELPTEIKSIMIQCGYINAEDERLF